MKNYNDNFLVDGSSALDTNRIGKHARTHIIEFPSFDDELVNVEELDKTQESAFASKISSTAHQVARRSEMYQSLKYGTCAGKPVGKMTPLQSALACGAFFAFFVSLLQFV